MNEGTLPRDISQPKHILNPNPLPKKLQKKFIDEWNKMFKEMKNP